MALVLVHWLAVRTEPGIAVLAPINVLARRRGGVSIVVDEETLPRQVRAPVLSDYGQRGAFHG
jgi:hypothetical protein